MPTGLVPPYSEAQQGDTSTKGDTVTPAPPHRDLEAEEEDPKRPPKGRADHPGPPCT